MIPSPRKPTTRPSCLKVRMILAFCCGITLQEYRRSGKARPKGLIAQGIDLDARKHAGNLDAQLTAEVQRDPLIITRQNFYRDACIRKIVDRQPRVRFWRVNERKEPSKREIAFMCADIRLLFGKRPCRNREYPKPFLTQAVELRHEALPRIGIQM